MEPYGSILIGDSCVGRLKPHLLEDNSLHLDVNSYPGASIESLKDTAEYITKHYPYEYMYIFGGVNDITTKNYATGNVTVNYADVDTMHTTLMARYTDCFKTVKSANASVKVIFLPLIGLDVATYNGRPRCKIGTGAYLTNWKDDILEHPMQGLVNDGVIAINETLIALNATQKKSTPLIHHTVHKRNRKHSPYRHLYFKLEDGLHPSNTIALAWSAVISKVVKKNLE